MTRAGLIAYVAHRDCPEGRGHWDCVAKRLKAELESADWGVETNLSELIDTSPYGKGPE